MNQVGKQAYIAVFAYAIDPHRPQSGKWQGCLLGSGTREAIEGVLSRKQLLLLGYSSSTRDAEFS